jgi:uncharacterized protein (DUF2062 family)
LRRVLQLRDQVAEQLVRQLRQGLSTEGIALTIAFGLCLAVFPVVGMTTILCFLAALAFRLNQPIIQAINWSSYLLQLLLILPFIRLGEWIFRGPRLTLSLDRLLESAKADPIATVASLWTITWHAIVAWALVAPLAGLLIYLAARPVIRALRRRLSSRLDDVDNVA